MASLLEMESEFASGSNIPKSPDFLDWTPADEQRVVESLPAELYSMLELPTSLGAAGFVADIVKRPSLSVTSPDDTTDVDMMAPPSPVAIYSPGAQPAQTSLVLGASISSNDASPKMQASPPLRSQFTQWAPRMPKA